MFISFLFLRISDLLIKIFARRAPRKERKSMVEKTHSSECHNHTVIVASLDNYVITDRTAGLGNIGNTGFFSAVDIVTEREESIGADRNTCNGIKVSSLFFSCEWIGSA